MRGRARGKQKSNGERYAGEGYNKSPVEAALRFSRHDAKRRRHGASG